MTEIRERVEVTQADRDAAADVWIRGYDLGSALAIREGNCDSHPLVQAFARHRLAAIAAVLQDLEAPSDGMISEAGVHAHTAGCVWRRMLSQYRKEQANG